MTALTEPLPDNRAMQASSRHLKPGELVFSSRGRLWHARGPVQQFQFDRGDDSHIWSTLQTQFAQHAADQFPIAIGAVGFDGSDPAVFWVADNTEPSSPDELATIIADRHPMELGQLSHTDSQPVTDELFADQVTTALAQIESSELSKVVLGRWLNITSVPELPASELLRRLLDQSPRAHVFSIPLDEGRHLVGASPELLLSKQGQTLHSFPLAGSVPRAINDPTTDSSRMAELRNSAKDLREHAPVVSEIVRILESLGVRVEAGEPEVVATDTMFHLGTRITGKLGDRELSLIEIVQALHPTPAVAGVPTSLAIRTISEIEPEPRGYLTGAAGWVDANGDGEFVVTLRSAIVDGPVTRLFAGAGIIAGSVPEAEAAETLAKLQTVRRAVYRR